MQAIDTYKATRSLIQAGESVMNQNKSALEQLPKNGGRLGQYEPDKYISTQSKMYPLSQFQQQSAASGSDYGTTQVVF